MRCGGQKERECPRRKEKKIQSLHKVLYRFYRLFYNSPAKLQGRLKKTESGVGMGWVGLDWVGWDLGFSWEERSAKDVAVGLCKTLSTMAAAHNFRFLCLSCNSYL